MTQLQLIREHLKKGGTLTQLQAYKKPFLCTNLSGRIAELRSEGLTFKEDNWITSSTGKRFKQYKLI